MAASNYFYYLAIDRTSVATAIVLQYVAPVLGTPLHAGARTAAPQRPTHHGSGIGGRGLRLCGGRNCHQIRASPGWVSREYDFSTIGVIAAELAAISFAFYNVYAQHLLQTYERWTVLVYALLGAAVFWMVLNPPWKIVAQHYSGGQWAFMAVFSMTSMLIPFSFYFAGLQHLDPTRAIVTSCLEPVWAILLTAVLLGELVSPIQVLGMVIVLSATVLIQRPDQSHREPTIAVEPIE